MSNYSDEGREWFRHVVLDLAGRSCMSMGEVARLAGISEATFRNARNNFDTPIAEKTLRGLGKAYRLRYGELRKVVENPGYEPQPATVPVTPGTSTCDDVLQFLEEFVALQPDEALKVRARIDVVWTKLPTT
jgi:hypothetical protein